MKLQFVNLLVSSYRALQDLPEPLDPPDLPAVDSTSSASLFRRRDPIPSAAATAATTALMTPT